VHDGAGLTEEFRAEFNQHLLLAIATTLIHQMSRVTAGSRVEITIPVEATRRNRLGLLIVGAQPSLEFVVRVLATGEGHRVAAAIRMMARRETAPGASQLSRVQRLFEAEHC
jgi:hypothetical protein